MNFNSTKRNVLEHIVRDVEAEPVNLPLSLLQDITKDFSDHHKVGQGGFGIVYKGVLDNGNVAVKRIFNANNYEEKPFQTEANFLMSVKHQNIVRFLGYCANTEKQAMKVEGKKDYIYAEVIEKLLCFEYMSKGSLENFITDELRGLEWHTRFEIIEGICNGLYYLHEEKNIIHMDLNPDNILLDDQMIPKITDFGLARVRDEKSKTMSLHRQLTLGYCAPEYQFDGRMSFKSDIYSLGIIIMQLVTGQKVIPNTKNVLRRWRHRWNKSGSHIPLQYLQVTKCIEIAVSCMENEPNDRPFIRAIVCSLSGIRSTDENISNGNESTVEQISSPYSRDLLRIEPLELHFPFELNKETRCSLQLTNDTDDYIAFRIETTRMRYCIQPKKEVVPPRSNCSVSISGQARQQMTEPGKKYNNELTVESISVKKGLLAEHITRDMFRTEIGKLVDEVALTVVFDALLLPEEPKVNMSSLSASGKEGANKRRGVRVSKILPGSGGQLDVHPLMLRFPFESDKFIPRLLLDAHKLITRSLHLTNNSDEHVAFRLQESNSGNTRFENLPFEGVVLPRSSYTLIVATKDRVVPPPERAQLLILKSCGVRDQHIDPSSVFDTYDGETTNVVHKLTLEANFFAKRGVTSSELVTPAIKIISMDMKKVIALDVEPTRQWILTGQSSGYIRIWNYERQEIVESFKVSKESVYLVKFISPKQLFMVGSHDGVIHLYQYETKIEKIKSFSGHMIKSLSYHSAQPYKLLTVNDRKMELRDLQNDLASTETIFEQHSGKICQVVFNPKDNSSFASACDDNKVMVWEVHSGRLLFTLSGHSEGVNCLDYFTCGDKQNLITGSNDGTAKIWDLVEKKCIRTLESLRLAAVTSLCSHPNLPIVLMGSADGIVHLWNSTNSRIERIFDFGVDFFPVLGCLEGSRRFVIGQHHGVSVLTINNLNYNQDACNEEELTAHRGRDQTASEISSDSCEILDVHPVKLGFPFKPNEKSRHDLHLTNKTDKLVAFRLIGSWSWPLYGIVQPRTICTLVVETREHHKPPNKKDFDLILQSTMLSDLDVHTFTEKFEYDQFFSDVKEMGNTGVHEVILKAVYLQQ
uniref:Uncharacterized protein n=1 Tax=Avena sativa TaxID=4498 RepID=A0ACD5YQ02_AVESA